MNMIEIKENDFRSCLKLKIENKEINFEKNL